MTACSRTTSTFKEYGTPIMEPALCLNLPVPVHIYVLSLELTIDHLALLKMSLDLLA